MILKCQVCNQKFEGRRDAKTCSMVCRKRLQRTRSTLAKELGVVGRQAESVVSAVKHEAQLAVAGVEHSLAGVVVEPSQTGAVQLGETPVTDQTTFTPSVGATLEPTASTPVVSGAVATPQNQPGVIPVQPHPQPTPAVQPAVYNPLMNTPTEVIASTSVVPPLESPMPAVASTPVVTPEESPISSVPAATESLPVESNNPFATPIPTSEPTINAAAAAEPLETVEPSPVAPTVPVATPAVAETGSLPIQAEGSLLQLGDTSNQNVSDAMEQPTSQVEKQSTVVIQTPPPTSPVNSSNQTPNQPEDENWKRSLRPSFRQLIGFRQHPMAYGLAMMILVMLLGLGVYGKFFNHKIVYTPVSSATDKTLTAGSRGSLNINRTTIITGGNSFLATGQGTFRDQINSTSAFQVQNAAGTDVFVVDTKNNRVGVGGAPTGQAAFQVFGDIVASGSVSADGGRVTLNAQGLSIDGNQLCTASGCSGSKQVSASQLPKEVTLQGNTFNGDSELVQTTSSGALPAISGANLTNLNADNITTGTLSDSRLSANVTLQGNSFNGANELVQLTSSGFIPALNGSLITDLDAGHITTGTLSDSRLSSNVALLNGTGPQTFTGNNEFTGTVLSQNAADSTSALAVETHLAAPVLVVDTTNQRVAIDKTTASFALDVHGDINTDSTFKINGNTICTSGGCTASSGSGDYIQNQNSTPQLANFDITGTGTAGFFVGDGSGLTNLNATEITSGTLNDSRLSANVTLQGNTFNGANELVQTDNLGRLPVISGVNLTNLDASNVTIGTLSDSRLSGNVPLLNAANIFTNSNIFKVDSTTALQVQNAAGSTNTLTVDTNHTRVAIGQTTANYTLDVNGDVNVTAGNSFRIGGNSICDASGCTPASGSNNYIQLQATTPGTIQTGNGNISGTFIAGSFSGNGASLTSLNASNITSGTLDDSHLSANVTLQGNSFNGSSELVQTTAAGYLPGLNGSLITNLDAGQITTGTLSDSRLNSDVAILSRTGPQVFTGDNEFLGTVLVNNSNSASLQVQNASNQNVLTVDTSGSQVVLGQASTLGGSLVFYNASGSGKTTLNSANPGASNYTVSLPAESGTICLEGSPSCGFGSSSANTVSLQATTPGVAQTGNINVTGTIIGGFFSGDGSQLTNLDAGQITTGTLSDSRLSADVTLQGNTFNGPSELVQLTAGGILPVLSGANLTNLNASEITSGTLDDLRLSSNVPLKNTTNVFTGINQFSRSGSGTSDYTLAVSGTPVNDSASSLIRIGDAISGGNSATNGGTYIGLNAPTSGAGSAADFINFQHNGTPKFTVDANGNVTAGTVNSATISGGSLSSSAVNGLSVSSGTINNPTISGTVTGSGSPTITGFGTINGQTISSAANFTGSVTIQGSGGLTLGVPGSTAGNLYLANATSSREVILQGLNPSGTGNATIQFPTIAGGATDTVCLVNLGNCAGSGTGVTTPGGTIGTLPVFSGSQSLADSLVSQSGSVVTVTGSLAVTDAGGLTVGTSSSSDGTIILNNASNSNTLTLKSGATGSNLTFTLPTADGSNGDCLKTNSAGVLSFQGCTAGGSGVTSLDSLTGVITLDNSTTSSQHIIIDNASTSQKGIAQFNSTNFSDNGSGTINTIQNINTTANPQFAGLTLGANNSSTGTLVFNSASGTGSITLSPNNPSSTAYTLHLPAENGTLCSTGSVCSGYAPATGGSGYIQLQGSTPGTQQTGNFNISGTGIAATALESPLFDTASAGTLAIGTTNATAIHLDQSVTLKAGSSFTFGSGGGGNFDQSSSTGTFATGTGNVSLNGATTVAANKNFNLASGSGTFSQTYTGTSTAASFTANSLTSGSALSVTSSNNTAANTSWSAVKLNVTNAQGTTAVTGSNYVAGLDLQFTQNPSISGNTNDYAANIAIAANSSATSDQSVAAILNLANNDTATGNQITAATGLQINGSNVTDGLYLNGTFGTNLINTSTGNLVIAQSGNITAGTYNTTTLNGTALTFGGAGTATIQSASSQSLNITAHNSSSFTTDSGNLTIDATASSANLKLGTGGQAKTIQIGSTTGAVAQTIGIGNNATASSTDTVTIGNLLSTSQTTVQGGTGAGAITLTQGSGGSIVIGSAAGSSAVTVQCGTGTCAFGANATDHSTTVGSSTGTSATTITSGSGGINLAGNVTISGTDTFTTGTGNVNLQGDTTVASGKNFTQNGTGTFSTGTGNVSLNGNTTIASGKSFSINGDTITDITGSGLNVSGSALQINLAGAGTSGTSSSGSGLEFNSGALTLLQGCTDGQVLKWSFSTSTWGCGAITSGAGAGTLQDAYNNSSSPATITLATGKNLDFVSPDVATDPNVIVNLQCATCSAGGGQFQVQNNGTNVFTIANNSSSTSAFTFQPGTDSTQAFQIQNQAGTSNLFIVDTTDNRIGIGKTSPGYTVDVNGDINISGAYRIGGTSVCSGTTCTPAAGSAFYIQAQASTPGTQQTSTNFNIDGTGIAATALKTAALDAASSGALQIANGGTATSVSICNSSACGNINIGQANGTANTISLGDSNDTLNIGANTTIQGSATFTTGTGNVSLNGATTVASNKAFAANGSATFTDATNSATAFQIQNSAGSSIFTADTTNQLITVANLQATGTISLQNGQGAGIQLRTVSNSSTGNAMTFSGNEITDQTRSVATQGDGRQAPDSSTGIWESTTNLVTNGGLESNTTGWQTGVSGANTATLSRVTTQSKFGSAALQVVTPGSTSQEGAATNDTTFTSGQAYTFSAWVKAPSGAAFRCTLGNATVGSAQNNYTGNGSWQKCTVSETATGTGSAHGAVNTSSSTEAITFYVDGAQLENKVYATPYVETNGSTATRNAARVQTPAANLNTTQGWFATRVRMGMDSSSVATGQVIGIFDWRNDSNNRYSVHYSGSSGKWNISSVNGGTLTIASTSAATFSKGDVETIVVYWTGSTIGLSVNGSNFITASPGAEPTITASTADIGSWINSNQLDGDVMWAAAGTGILSNTDAASLYNLGNSDPTLTAINSIDGSSIPTFAWDGESTQYSGTNNSLTNDSQISIDDVNLTHTSNGSISIQGAANSTTAFQVQNASGSTIFNVDTSGGVVAVTGNQTVSGTINSDTLTSSTLTFGAASTATISAAASQALALQGTNFNISSSGDLTLRPGTSAQVFAGNLGGGAAGIQSASGYSLTVQSGDTSHYVLLQPSGGSVGIGITPTGAGLLQLASSTSSTAGITFGTDTNLYRSAADTLKTDDTFVSGVAVQAPLFDAASATALQIGSTATSISLNKNVNAYGPNGISTYSASSNEAFRNFLLNGDSQPAFKISGGGQLLWGPGGSTGGDTNLYRTSADNLKTDDSLTVGTNLTVSGTINTDTLSSTALTFSGASPVISASTTNTGITLQANGTGTLALNTSGSGTVNLGTTNSTTVGIGNASSTNTVLGTTNINNSGTANTTIGNSAGGTITIGASTGSDLALQDAQWSVTGAGTGKFAAVGVGATPSNGRLLMVQGANSSEYAAYVENTDTGSTSGGLSIRVDQNSATNIVFNAQVGSSNTRLQVLGNNTINVGTTGSATAASTINIANTSDATGTQAISIGSAAKAANSITLEAGTGTTALFNGATAHTIQLATGAAVQTVTIGSTNTTSALTLQAGSGGVTLTGTAQINNSGSSNTSIGALATGGTITVGNTSGTDLVLQDANWNVTGAGAATFASITNNGTYNGNTFTNTRLAFSAASTATVDSASGQGIAIGDTNATSVTLGNTTNTSSIVLQGAAAATYTIGNANTTGIITLGQSTDTNTIKIGSAGPADTKTQTINIGNGSADGTTSGGVNINIASGIPGTNATNTTRIGVGAGKNVITVGSTSGASSLLLQAGTGNVDVETAASSTISIGTGNVASKTISIGSVGSTAQATTINIANTSSTAVAQNVTIGSATAGSNTGATNINSGTGNITLQAAGSATTGKVVIGAANGGGGSSTPDLLVLDESSSSSDPTCTTGAIYYNASGNQFRGCTNGTWYNLITAIDIQIYTSSSTWTKPSGATLVQIIAVGGGGGGGSGQCGAASTVREGGGGGGGGAYSATSFAASLLGSTETVTVGAGGGGGTTAACSGNGTAGTGGGSSSFGAWVAAQGGGGGNKGTSSDNQNGGGNGGKGLANGSDGTGGNTNSASANGATSTGLSAAGGGGGGGTSDTNSNKSGGGGGSSQLGLASPLSGGGSSGNGGSASVVWAIAGAGGGGGGHDANGGNGGSYGGGGGGGGGSTSSTKTSGGSGADGIVVVISF